MLTFNALRKANRLRLPQFRDRRGELAHSREDGSDWTPAQWLQAVIGELGEYANVRKKFERGDLTHDEFIALASAELADVQTYLDILAARALDIHPGMCHCQVRYIHPTGVDLGRATVEKFNEVSLRVKSDICLTHEGFVVSDGKPR